MIAWIIILIVMLLILAMTVGVDAAPEPEEKPSEQKKEKKKKKLTLDDILTLAEIGLDALRRFRMHLSVDRIMLHYTAAAADPYDAVQQYGKVNAALGVLAG